MHLPVSAVVTYWEINGKQMKEIESQEKKQIAYNIALVFGSKEV